MISVKKPTDILREEHQSVLGKLAALEAVIAHLEGKQEGQAKLRELTSFFSTEFWVHFTKEEEALFPEIEKFLPRNMGPIGVMLMEHEELRNTNAKLQQATDGYLKDPANAGHSSAVRTLGTRFVESLRDHIHKEDNILFAMADMHLDETQIERVNKLFDKIAKGGK